MSKSIVSAVIETAMIASLLFPKTAFAQEQGDTTKPVSLDAIRVEDQDDNSSVVTGKYIEEKQAHNLQETFKDNPDVVVGGPQRAAQKIYVRGIEDTNLNVTVDGARQSGYMFHHQTRLNVDPELLKQVDVDAGTGNALAGPGALGGAIRFVTKDVEDLLLPNKNWGSLVKGWYDTNNDEKGGSVAFFGRPSEKVSALGYLTLSESNDERAGGGDIIPYTAGKPKSALVKVSYRPTTENKITLGSNFASDNAVRLARANMGGTETSATMDRVFETLNTTLSYDYVPTASAHAVHAETYLTNNKLQSKSGTGSEANFQSYGVTASDTYDQKWWKVTFGADGNQDNAKARNQTREGKENGAILGVFAQAKFNITDRWSAGTGARYDDYKLTSIDDQKFTDSHLSPNFNMGYQWTKAWSSKISWNQAFRGPVPVEVFLLANATSVAPVSNLKGTVAETTELDNKWKLDEIQTTFDLNLYSTILRDPLESSVSGGAIVRKNSGKDLTTQGLEAKAKKSFGDVDGSVFYTHSTTKYGSDDIGYSGNFTRGVSLGDRIGLGVEWRMPEHRIALDWNSTFVMKLTDVPSGYPNQPGYSVHDVAATWLVSERLRTTFTISNIFDEKYVAQGSWYATNSGNENLLYEPGRDFRFAASYQF